MSETRCERGVSVQWARGAKHDPAFTAELLQIVQAALADGVDPDDGRIGEQAQDSVNPGRSRVDFISVQNRPLVLRHYCRGGMMRHLLRDSFMRVPMLSGLSGATYRPFEELTILERLGERGVSVPTPVIGAVKHICGGWAYRAVIVTEELPEVQNLLFLALTAKLQAEEQTAVADLCRKAGTEAAKMIAEGVSHPDLHLGNVLVQRGEQVVLIDFDRAHQAADSGSELVGRLQRSVVERWNRSLAKHGVLEFAADAFEAGLRGEVR